MYWWTILAHTFNQANTVAQNCDVRNVCLDNRPKSINICQLLTRTSTLLRSPTPRLAFYSIESIYWQISINSIAELIVYWLIGYDVFWKIKRRTYSHPPKGPGNGHRNQSKCRDAQCDSERRSWWSPECMRVCVCGQTPDLFWYWRGPRLEIV